MRSRIPALWIVALLLAAALPGAALDLEEAVATAEQNSLRLEASGAEAKAARQTARQALSHLFPQLEVMEIFDRTTNPVQSFGMTLNKEQFDPMAMQFPDRINEPDPGTTWITRVEARLPLFAGGRITTGIRQANLMAEAGEATHAHTLEEVRVETIGSWLDLARAREYVSLLEKARATTEAHVQRARAYSEEGFLVRSELLRAEVYLSEMDDMLTRARQGAAMAQAALNLRMGLPQETAQHLGRTPDLPAVEGELNELVAEALAARGDLRAARLQSRAGRLQERSALGDWLPEAGLLARHDWYDEDFGGSEAGSWTVMGSLSWTFNLGGGQYWKQSAAGHQARAWEAKVSHFEEGVRLQVRQGLSEYELARERSRTSAQALEAGRENLRILEERFEQGVASTLDLLDAQTALRELETRELVTRHEALVAAYRLRLLSGQAVLSHKKEGE